MRLCRNQYAVICDYHDRPYVGFHRLDAHGAIIAGKGMNLDLSEWQKFATHLPSLMMELAPSLVQYKSGDAWYFLPQAADEDTRFVTMPAVADLMEMVYRWQVRHNINEKIKEACAGCRYDAPGKLDHMGPSGMYMSFIIIQPHSTIQ